MSPQQGQAGSAALPSRGTAPSLGKHRPLKELCTGPSAESSRSRRSVQPWALPVPQLTRGLRSPACRRRSPQPAQQQRCSHLSAPPRQTGAGAFAERGRDCGSPGTASRARAACPLCACARGRGSGGRGADGTLLSGDWGSRAALRFLYRCVKMPTKPGRTVRHPGLYLRLPPPLRAPAGTAVLVSLPGERPWLGRRSVLAWTGRALA